MPAANVPNDIPCSSSAHIHFLRRYLRKRIQLLCKLPYCWSPAISFHLLSEQSHEWKVVFSHLNSVLLIIWRIYLSDGYTIKARLPYLHRACSYHPYTKPTPKPCWQHRPPTVNESRNDRSGHDKQSMYRLYFQTTDCLLHLSRHTTSFLPISRCLYRL